MLQNVILGGNIRTYPILVADDVSRIEVLRVIASNIEFLLDLILKACTGNAKEIELFQIEEYELSGFYANMTGKPYYKIRLRDEDHDYRVIFEENIMKLSQDGEPLGLIRYTALENIDVVAFDKSVVDRYFLALKLVQ